MTHTNKISVPGIIWVMLGITCLVFAPRTTLAETAVGDIICRCPGLAKNLGSAPNCEVACFGSSASPEDDSDNNEAARRAQEAAAAERQRQQEETDRIKRERVAAEKRKEEEQAELIRNRDKTVLDLKGPSGTPTLKLKGVSGMDSYGLKGRNTGNTGLKGLRDSDHVTRETQGQQTAWKQLHCASEIAGYALKNLEQKGDYDEFGGLSIEALKALDGQRLTVECHAAPPFPGLHGRAVDMDQGKQAQRTILSRARVIAERMKQRGDQPTVSPELTQTTTETSEDKMRRVQRELNQANSQKITGKTQSKIDQQKRDREELAKLILANNGLEKGEFISIIPDTNVESSPVPRRKPVPAP